MQRTYGSTFNDFYENNRLRKNLVSGVYTATVEFLPYFFARYNVKRTEKVTALLELTARFPDIAGYDDKSSEEKMRIVGDVETYCKGFFAIMTRGA